MPAACRLDHKLYWMPVRNIDEARYLTALLNSPSLTEAVSVYQSRGLFGARDFDKYVWRLPIPVYEAANPLHAQLTELAEQAEIIAGDVNLDGVGFQKARQLIRSALDAAGITSAIDSVVVQILGLEQS